MAPQLLEASKPMYLRNESSCSGSKAKTEVRELSSVDEISQQTVLAVDWKSIEIARAELRQGGGLLLEQLPDAETAFKLLDAG